MMMDLAVLGLKEKKKKKVLAAAGNDNIGSSASTVLDSPLSAHIPRVGADGIVDSPSTSDRQSKILQKAEYNQAQHRRRSKMVVVPQSSARVHDFELCLSHGNRRTFDSKSPKQKNARKKYKDRRSSSAAKVRLFDKFRDMQQPVEEEDGDSEGLDDTSRTFERLVRRSALEEEVLLLQTRLEEELELRSVLESALSNVSGALSSFPHHLPIAAQELLADITVLEVAVLKLKEKSTALQWQVGQERTEREIAELCRGRSGPMSWQPEHQRSPISPMYPQQMILAADSQPSQHDDHLPFSSLQNLLTDRQAQAAESQFQQLQIIERDESDQTTSLNGHDVQSMFSFQDQHSMEPSSFTQCLTSAVVASCEDPLSDVLTAVITEEEPSRSLLSPSNSQEQEKHILPETTSGLESLKALPVHVKDVPSHPSPPAPPSNKEQSWSFCSEDHHIVGNYQQLSGQNLSPVMSPGCESVEGNNPEWESSDLAETTPNQLSEQMVQCMVSIYCHLADSDATTLKLGSSSPSGGIHSPTSPFGRHQANSSSLSSISKSSLLSFARSPLVDLRNKEEVIGTDATPDPFKVPDKIPWMDIGAYGHTFEVPWLSVSKDQLEYAAQALQGFKLLVEQLASVDPSHLSHDEKLAFWINLYNTVMMHGYLAYGIPQSDLKFFSLLQKAAYTVGGHSFNAATMEYCLLKSKSTATRPHIMLLMALHRNKLTNVQMKFGIDQTEPLINFALCCGTQSAPMVRIYTAEKVHLQLQDAFHDYARAAVGMSTKGKLLVPKLLHCYAREFVEDNALLAWIFNLLSDSQVAVIGECIQQRHRHHILGSRNFTIIPFDFTFRYLFPANIARKLMSL